MNQTEDHIAPGTEFDLESFWLRERDEHKAVMTGTFTRLTGEFGQWLDVSAESVRNGNKILFFGNGGSAADAQHLATELTIRFHKDRAAIPALALTTDTSALTAAGNDIGFERIFSRQIEALGRAGDVAVGISTSGNSPNVLLALEEARRRAIVTIGLSGKDGGKMRDLCDILLIVPSQTTARIQEMHITLGHMFCAALEEKLGYLQG